MSGGASLAVYVLVDGPLVGPTAPCRGCGEDSDRRLGVLLRGRVVVLEFCCDCRDTFEAAVARRHFPQVSAAQRSYSADDYPGRFAAPTSRIAVAAWTWSIWRR